MKRYLVSIFVALLFVGVLPAQAAKKSVKGTVTCDGVAVAGVVVTDGVNITKTDAQGKYALPTKVKEPQNQFVYISIPSGYEVERIGNAPQFYKRINPKAKKATYDFKLTKVDQSKYTLLTIADAHLCGGLNKRGHKDDRERYISTCVSTLREEAAKCNERVYVISLGDMTQPQFRPGYKGREQGYTFKNYMEDTDVDCPIFNAIGNHDHNQAPKGEIFNEETVYQSRKDYNDDLGPEYYSFNIGREHFVVVDNTFVITKDYGSTKDPKATKGYWVKLCERQHNWLAQDIAALDKSKVDRIVVLAHCGVLSYTGKYQQMDAERMLEYFKGYEVVALIGHHHCDYAVKKNINGKPFYQFVHPSAAGMAWYSYDSTEGSFAAIAKYTVDNGKWSRKYIPYGSNKGTIYRVYDNGDNKWHYPITSRTGSKRSYELEQKEATADDKPAILVNIMGAHTCEFIEATGGKGKVVRRCYDLKFRDWYWPTYRKSEAGEMPKGERLYKASWQTPKRGYHNWRYIPADPDAEIRVVAKDIFGEVVADFKARAK